MLIFSKIMNLIKNEYKENVKNEETISIYGFDKQGHLLLGKDKDGSLVLFEKKKEWIAKILDAKLITEYEDEEYEYSWRQIAINERYMTFLSKYITLF